uniref:Uncharacterized protein n=1 Tax=Anopheles dirus TaxID=7168 RepID=A0A182NYF7_9DIPT
MSDNVAEGMMEEMHTVRQPFLQLPNVPNLRITPIIGNNSNMCSQDVNKLSTSSISNNFEAN